MSAHAYIQYADVPSVLVDSSHQRIDSATQAKLISFDGCPLTGEIEQLSGGHLQIEFPFPQAGMLRHALVDWLIHWGISFTVVA